MPAVARTRHGDRLLGGTGTLLARCLEAGLPVASSCSGRGACGRCAVTVLAGASWLPEPALHEQEVLARNGFGPDHRLACQCAPFPATRDLLISTGYW